MSGKNILGKLQVMLGLDSASFEEGLSKAEKQSQYGAKQIENSFKSTGRTLEETGGKFSALGEHAGGLRSKLGLLDNTIRGAKAQGLSDLVRIFSNLSFVMTALPFAAAIAGIGLVGELAYSAGQKMGLFGDTLRASKTAMDDFDASSESAMRGFRDKLLSAEGEVDSLTGDHLGQLQTELQQIDNQSLDNLDSAFKKLVGIADAYLKTLKGVWYELGNPGKEASQQLAAVQAHYTELLQAGNAKGAAAYLAAVSKAHEQLVAAHEKVAGTPQYLRQPIMQGNTLIPGQLNPAYLEAYHRQTAAQEAYKQAVEGTTKSLTDQQKADQALTRTFEEMGTVQKENAKANDQKKLAADYKYTNEQAQRQVKIADEYNARLKKQWEVQKANDQLLADFYKKVDALQPKPNREIESPEALKQSLLDDPNVKTKFDDHKDALKTYAEFENKTYEGELLTAKLTYDKEFAAFKELLAAKLIAQGDYEKAVKSLKTEYAKEVADIQAKFGHAAFNEWQELSTDIRQSIDQLNSDFAKSVFSKHGLNSMQWRQQLEGIGDKFAGTAFKGLEASTLGKIPGVGKFFANKRDGQTAQSALFTTTNASGTLGDPSTKMSQELTKLGDKLEGVFKHLGSALEGIFSHLGGFFSHIFGGFFASGGNVSPGSAYVVGEHGAELFMPSMAGTIVPNSAFKPGNGGGNIYIDARGATAGVEEKIRQAMRLTENRSVARSVATISEMQKRR